MAPSAKERRERAPAGGVGDDGDVYGDAAVLDGGSNGYSDSDEDDYENDSDVDDNDYD
jgi:hypothetical protein